MLQSFRRRSLTWLGLQSLGCRSQKLIVLFGGKGGTHLENMFQRRFLQFALRLVNFFNGGRSALRIFPVFQHCPSQFDVG